MKDWQSQWIGQTPNRLRLAPQEARCLNDIEPVSERCVPYKPGHLLRAARFDNLHVTLGRIVASSQSDQINGIPNTFISIFRHRHRCGAVSPQKCGIVRVCLIYITVYTSLIMLI